MSRTEYDLLMSGGELYNLTDFASKGSRTSSSGFCFLGEETRFTDGSGRERVFSPYECLDFLFGIVSSDLILVEFSARTDLRKTWGIYADPTGGMATIKIDEYCTCHYNRRLMVPVRATFINGAA